MIGSKISVAVADAKGNKDVSDETAPVAVYEELEILDAEQKGAKTIEATFSEAITGLDKLTVSKNGEELKQAYAAKIADDGLSATITLENRITAGTYTVTLTPANGDDKSEAEFEGEVAALNSIEFVSDYLIMKDNEYKEGYAYIKGTDQFGDDMSLSSVTVIPGYGHFRSYDATTGKITIGVDDGETNFAIVKEVPVFVTYQNGADTIPANATLKVTTMSYVQELTFGDIYKADGTVVDDDTNPLMISDLKSKPYVEIKDVEDQYGNPLSAKDLNDQATGNTKVLFVIPDETTTSAYYSTGKFSTITEKDGTKKTILYLASGGDMPGSMDLIITGASGQSFSTPVTVKDDPYIDTLRVNYPTLYEGTDESDKLEFTAIDQYGHEIKDLFDFAPTVQNDNILVFGDMNHQTGKVTSISAPAEVKWIVRKDNIKKKFDVAMQLVNGGKKGQTLVMMATTAGLKVTPTNLTVGQRTNGESIDTTIGGNLALDPQNREFDFNQNVRFLSSNGTVMDRVENAQYPVFVGNTTNVDTTAPYNIAVTEDKPAFFWTVSRGKEGQVTKNANGDFVIGPTTETLDTNGTVTVAELDGANTTTTATTIVNTGDYVEHKNATYYVTLYKKSVDSAGKETVAVIDKQSFKLTYSPTRVNGEFQLGTKYTAEIKENRDLFADADKTDSVTIRVKAYPNVGEPYYVDNTFVEVTGNTANIKAQKDANNELKVTATKAGSATFSVYVQEGNTQGVYTTVKVTAEDKQTATKVQKDFKAVAVAGTLNSKVGAGFTDSSRTATEWSADEKGTNTITVANGQMKITNGNRLGEELTLGIKDQHDLPMTNAKFYVNGEAFEDFWTNTLGEAAVPAAGKTKTAVDNTRSGNHIIEVRSADDSIIQHYTIKLGTTTWTYTKAKTTATPTVYNETQLKNAFTAGSNDTVTLGKDITLTANFGATEIETGDKLIVPAEYKLDIDGKTLTVNGKLEVSGEVADTATGGTVTGDGTVTVKKGAIYNVTSSLTPADDSLHVEKGATVKVTNLGGYVYTNESIVADKIVVPAGKTTVITIDEGLNISTAAGTVPTIAANAKIIVKDEDDDAEASIKLGGHEFDAKVDATTGDLVIDTASRSEAADKATVEDKLYDLHTALEAYNKATTDATKLDALKSAYGTAKSAVTTYSESYNDANKLNNYADLATAKTAMVNADKAKLTAANLAFKVSQNASEDDAISAVEDKANGIDGLCFTDWAVANHITGFASSTETTVEVSLTLASEQAGENKEITGIAMTVSNS